MYVCICQPLHISRIGCKVIFKQILTDMEPEFSFFKPGCQSSLIFIRRIK